MLVITPANYCQHSESVQQTLQKQKFQLKSIKLLHAAICCKHCAFALCLAEFFSVVAGGCHCCCLYFCSCCGIFVVVVFLFLLLLFIYGYCIAFVALLLLPCLWAHIIFLILLLLLWLLLLQLVCLFSAFGAPHFSRNSLIDLNYKLRLVLCLWMLLLLLFSLHALLFHAPPLALVIGSIDFV